MGGKNPKKSGRSQKLKIRISNLGGGQLWNPHRSQNSIILNKNPKFQSWGLLCWKQSRFTAALSLASITSKTRNSVRSSASTQDRWGKHDTPAAWPLTRPPRPSLPLCLPSSYLHSCCCLTGALVLACSHTPPPPLTCLPRARTNPAVARCAQTYSKFLTSVLEKKGLNSQDIFHLFYFIINFCELLWKWSLRVSAPWMREEVTRKEGNEVYCVWGI